MKRIATWLCIAALVLGLGVMPGYCEEDWQFAQSMDNAFCDGYVWEEYYCSDGGSYYVCVDQSGRAKYRLVSGFSEPSPSQLVPEPSLLENGYIQIAYGGCVTVFDMKGRVTCRIPYDDENELAAYGAGYTVIFSKATGFDASGYYYTMYGPNGDVAVSKMVNGSVNSGTGGSATTIVPSWSSNAVQLSEYIRYCGQGVFFIDGTYYCSKNQSRTELNSGLLFYAFGEDGWSNLGYSPDSMIRMNSNGETWVTNIPYSYDFWTGFVIGETTMKKWYAYDIETDKWYVLDDYYAARIVDVNESGVRAVYSDEDRIAIQMRGDDGKLYFAMFDTQWQEIIKPAEGNINGLKDGFLSVNSDGGLKIYNSDGEQIVSKGYSSSFFGGGVAIVRDEVYDRDGKLLFNFNDVNISKAIDLNESLKNVDDAKTVTLAGPPQQSSNAEDTGLGEAVPTDEYESAGGAAQAQIPAENDPEPGADGPMEENGSAESELAEQQPAAGNAGFDAGMSGEESDPDGEEFVRIASDEFLDSLEVALLDSGAFISYMQEKYSDELYYIDWTVSARYWFLQGDGTGEEMCLFTANDERAAEWLLGQFQSRLEFLSIQLDYLLQNGYSISQDIVDRIQNGFAGKCGDFVYMAVADDPVLAREIIEEYIADALQE